MYRSLTGFLILSLITITVRGQQAVPAAGRSLDPERVFFGGNFAMNFGANSFVNISPQVGYQFSNFFAAGGGVNFISYSYTAKDVNGNRVYQDRFGYAGLNAFARIFPLPFLFASVQPEYNYSWGKIKYFNGQSETKRPGTFVPILLVGGGAVIPTAGRGRLIASLQYDLLQQDRSPYGRQAFFSFGYNF